METLILFAHGAGAASASEWMRGWARRLSALGAVETFDYPYVRDGRRAPDRLPRLLDAHREALQAARRRHPRAERVVLCGKSMGARVGCHLSLGEPVDALVCLGYPLRGQSGALRDEVLLALRAPVLFVSGTRDPLCSLELLETVRKRMRAPNAVHAVQSGDHSLRITAAHARRAGLDQDGSDAAALAAVAAFLEATRPVGSGRRGA